jgi:hypothetical protein
VPGEDDPAKARAQRSSPGVRSRPDRGHDPVDIDILRVADDGGDDRTPGGDDAPCDDSEEEERAPEAVVEADDPDVVRGWEEDDPMRGEAPTG